MRRKYDLRELVAALEQRNKAAHEAAARFAEALAGGMLDPTAGTFNQGENIEGAPAKCAPQSSLDIQCSWIQNHLYT